MSSSSTSSSTETGGGAAAPELAALSEKYLAFQERGRTLVAEVRSLLPNLVEQGRPLAPALLQSMAVYKQKYIALCEFAWPNRTAPVAAPTFEHFQLRLDELTPPPAPPPPPASLEPPPPLDPVARIVSLAAIPGSEGLLETIRAKVSDPPEGCKDRVNVIASDLLSLISGDENVSDERWQELLDSVTALFGREVAFAAARGKLKFPPA